MRLRERATMAAAILVASIAAIAPARAADAPRVDVTVTPATPGTATAPLPVAVAVRAILPAPSAAPQPLHRLEISLPAGFATTLATIPSCVEPAFAAYGSAACPADTRIGSGGAAFVYAFPGLRQTGATDEVALFHGARSGTQSALYLYVHVSKPIAVQFVVPGTIADRPAPAGPLVAFDLSRLANPTGNVTVSVTRAALDVARGLAAGPCDATGHWRFTARLTHDGGAVDEVGAQAACGPDTIAPTLRASARDGTPALGARFAVRLSERARVKIVLERRAGGRWALVRRMTARAREGASVLRIRRAHGRPLPRGRYRARLQAIDGAGLTSPVRRVSFRLR